MFEYTIDASADEPIMLILKQIGHTCDAQGNITEYGVAGSDFCRELLLLDAMGKKRIQVWINSIGGSVIDGYSILGAMLKAKTPVDTYNIGVAASTAGWLFEAGRNRDMSDYATWMGHNPHSTQGDHPEILDKFRTSITHIIAARTGKDDDLVADMLEKETYMTASECLMEGFCDTITVTSRQHVKSMKNAATITDKYHTAAQIVNQFLPDKNTEIMDVNKMDISITNKLGLDADATPATVARAIADIKNKLASETDRANGAEDALKISNKTKSEIQRRYDEVLRENDELKCRAEEEATATRLKAAKDLVNSFVAMGKIENKAEFIQPWVNLAKGSAEELETVKNMLTALPVNKEAKKIDVVNTLNGNGGSKNLSMKMHELARKHSQK